MTPSNDHPYELHQHGGGFTVFEAADAVGLPITQLNRATLRGTGGQMMVLDFDSTQVLVDGNQLAELFGHLLGGRVKTIRKGKHGDCVVAKIQIAEM
jgi:hypothetical protein